MAMDRQVVFARTNKGHKEVAGRTTFLKHADRSVLFLVTGKEALGEIAARIDPSIVKRLDSVVQKLLREEFIYRPEPHEISVQPERISAGRLSANGTIESDAVVTLEPAEVSLEPAADAASDDLVNALLRQAKESARRQGLIERMRQVEADARKKAAGPAGSTARGMVLPAKRLQAAYTAQIPPPEPEPVLDRKRILARSGKGALEFIGRTCTLRPGLQKILSQVDGVSTVEEIQRRIGHSEKAVAAALETLLQRGYVQDSSAVLEGLEPEVGFDAGITTPAALGGEGSTTARLAQFEYEAIEAERATLADVWRELAAQQRREMAEAAEEAARLAVAQQARRHDEEEGHDEHRVRTRPSVAPTVAPDPAIRHAERARRAMLKARQVSRKTMARIALAVSVFVLIGYLVSPLFDTARYESAASQYFDTRVRIGSASLSLWPRPAVKLSDVRVGDDSRGVRVESAYAHLGLEWFAGSEMVVPLVEIDGATVTAAELRALLQPSAVGKPHALALRRIQGKHIHIVDTSWKLNNATVDVEIGRNHAVRRLTVASGDGQLKAQFLPAADGVISLEVSATKVPLLGSSLVIDQFDARGSYSADEFVLREFDGRVLGGVVHGQARIRQGATWVAEGTIEARGLELAQIARPLFDDGTLSAKGRFKTSASTPHDLFAAGNVDGTLAVDRGTFTGADLARVVLRDDSPRGSTLFTELSGGFSAQLGSRLSINNIRFKSNRIAGAAAAQIEGNGALRAQISGSLWTPQGPVNSGVDLTGTIRRPVLARRD